jgi:hypothetical protein
MLSIGDDIIVDLKFTSTSDKLDGWGYSKVGTVEGAKTISGKVFNILTINYTDGKYSEFYHVDFDIEEFKNKLSPEELAFFNTFPNIPFEMGFKTYKFIKGTNILSKIEN